MTESTRPRAVGVNHIALEVGDIDEALAFYGRLFAFDLRGKNAAMAFIGLGDQFIALQKGRRQAADDGRHFGLVVDDKEAARKALNAAGVELIDGPFLDFRDPWGNRVEIVGYDNIQFTKAPNVLRGMGLSHLAKNERAKKELAEKGIQVNPTGEYVEGTVRDNKGKERHVVLGITHREVWIMKGREWVKPPRTLDLTMMAPGLIYLFLSGTRAGQSYDSQMNWKFLRDYTAHLSGYGGEFWTDFHNGRLPQGTTIRNTEKLLDDITHILQSYKPGQEEVNWLRQIVTQFQQYFTYVGQNPQLSYRAALQDRGPTSLPKLRQRVGQLRDLLRTLTPENNAE